MKLETPQDLPLLVTASQVSFMTGFSVRAAWRLNSKGSLPEKVSVTGTRWVRREIELWIADGCPDLKNDRLRYRNRPNDAA